MQQELRQLLGVRSSWLTWGLSRLYGEAEPENRTPSFLEPREDPAFPPRETVYPLVFLSERLLKANRRQAEAKALGKAWPGLDGERSLTRATSLWCIPCHSPSFVFQHLPLWALSPAEHQADPNADSVHCGKP